MHVACVAGCACAAYPAETPIPINVQISGVRMSMPTSVPATWRGRNVTATAWPEPSRGKLDVHVGPVAYKPRVFRMIDPIPCPTGPGRAKKLVLGERAFNVCRGP